MSYSRPGLYPYPKEFKSLEDANKYAKDMYAALLEKDSRADYMKDRSTDKDLKELIVRPEWYGAKGDGVTNDTAAINYALTAALGLGSGAVLQFSGKTYLTDGITAFGTGTDIIGLTIQGVGNEKTILKARGDNHVIEITGTSVHTLTIKDLRIDGYGSGTKHGIYMHDNTNCYHIFFRDLRVTGCGGRGIYCPDPNDTSTYERLFVDECGDNNIEGGGMTTILNNCYVGTVSPGKAGYRFYTGSPVFISCNGITGSNANTTWGLFGSATQYCRPIFIGCNIEDFHSTGIYCMSGSVPSFWGCSFIGPATALATDIVAIQLDGNSDPGWLDSQTFFYLSGSSYKDGYPIHVKGSQGFITLGSASGVTQLYNDDTDTVYNMAQIRTALIGAGEYGLDIPRARISATDYVGLNELVSFSANDATPSVAGHNNFRTYNSNPTTITMFDGGAAGQTVFVLINDNNTTVDFSGTQLWGNAGRDWSPVSGDSIKAVFDGSWWYCECTGKQAAVNGITAARSSTTSENLAILQQVSSWQDDRFENLAWKDSSNIVGAFGMNYEVVAAIANWVWHSAYNVGYKSETDVAMKLGPTGNLNPKGNLLLESGKVVNVDGTQVVGAQQTGVAAMTNLTAPANLDADTVTTAELADIVGNLITKLRTHGLVTT